MSQPSASAPIAFPRYPVRSIAPVQWELQNALRFQENIQCNISTLTPSKSLLIEIHSNSRISKKDINTWLLHNFIRPLRDHRRVSLLPQLIYFRKANVPNEVPSILPPFHYSNFPSFICPMSRPDPIVLTPCSYLLSLPPKGGTFYPIGSLSIG